MPLFHGGKEAVSKNVKELYHANAAKPEGKKRGRAQIVAIAINAAKRRKKPSPSLVDKKGNADFGAMAARMKG